MRRIVYDYQIFLNQQYGGISRYFYELALRIGCTKGFSATIFAPLQANSYLAGGRVRFRGVQVRKLPKIWKIYDALDIALSMAYLQVSKPAILHETYYARRSVAPRNCPIVITVYDMIHEKFSAEFGVRDKTTALKRRAVERANRVICISENTRRDLIDLLGVPEWKAVTVPLGFGLALPEYAEDAPQLRIIREPYLLYVGSREFHKNFDGFLRAYAASTILRKNFSIVAFGGPPLTAAEFRLMDLLDIAKNRVEWLRGSDVVLAHLYDGAAAFVYPSHYEGFGIPPLEAMSRNCPVVCSNKSSMPEVVGDAAVMFEPSDPASIMQAIESVVSSASLRESLLVRGRSRIENFSWERCAAATAAVYSDLLQ